MIRYTDEYIEQLLAKFMDGESTLEEEARLGDYFRTQKVRPEWEEYRMMFAYFDSGMEGPIAADKPKPRGRWLRRVVAAAACVAVICGMAALFLHDNRQEQLMAWTDHETVRFVRPVAEMPIDTVVTAKADKPTVARKAAGKRHTPHVMEPDKDVEQAKEELRRTQEEIAEAYNEIAEVLEEIAVTDLEVQEALGKTMPQQVGLLHGVPQPENKRTLVMQ